jgi:hypothetical protein
VDVSSLLTAGRSLYEILYFAVLLNRCLIFLMGHQALLLKSYKIYFTSLFSAIQSGGFIKESKTLDYIGMKFIIGY